MRDINTDAASGHPQLCALQNESEDRIRFTPVKRAADTIPRAWDRKPSTSYLAKSSRPRKVWKRFRTSFNTMKALQQMVDAASERVEEDDLNTEINSSRNSSLLRGLKRRCLDAGWEEDVDSGAAGRKRSFLETKWESEIQRRRIGKLPMNSEMDITTVEKNDCQAEFEQQPVTSIADVDTQKDELAGGVDMDPTYPEPLHGSSDKDGFADIDPTPEPTTDAATEEKVNDITPIDEPRPETSKKETAPAEEIISAEQESTLVRSALRSSLDGDDAEVLNNFLSKAKAKRAAKAAMAAQEQTTTEEKTAQEEEVAIPNLPTPRSRRALGELDANSPSPSPQKVASARKAEDASGSPVRKEAVPKEDKGKNAPQQEQQPSSPTATRRSTRTRTPRAPPKSNIPTPQNTLSLRRAKGNEFVFLQRTEAQELALVTRKNTKNNKGNSVLPKYTLQTLSKGQGSAEASPSSDSSSGSERSGSGKRVCWNDARLVEYEDGEEPQPAASVSPEPTEEFSDSITRAGPDANTNKKAGEKQKTPSSNNRSTRSQTTVITMPQSPAARRVRRLGNQAAATTTTKPEPTPAASCKGMYTSSSTRKKLTPKAPSSGLLGTPPSKKSVSISANTTTIGRSTGTATGSRETSTKSKSIFKANAGSTPMPKRVRSRA